MTTGPVRDDAELIAALKQPFCQTYLDQMRLTIRALGPLPEASISPEMLQARCLSACRLVSPALKRPRADECASAAFE